MIQIKSINKDNVFDVCDLTTNQNGIGTVMEEYLCSNAVSISESKYFPEMNPRAIYDDEQLIGFFMYEQKVDSQDIATINRFMIDYKFQHQGLGRASLKQIIKYLKNKGVNKVILMIDDHNEVAKQLYISLGFEFTGKVYKDEYYYDLDI